MPTRLYLCRHGEVNGDGHKRYNGHRDVDITDTGVQQMERLREMLCDKPLDTLYSSDLIRTVKGAEIIGRCHAMARKVQKFSFRERKVGEWEGLTWDEIQTRYPDEWAAWLNDIVHFVPPDGESLLQVHARVIPELELVIEQHKGGEILLMAHGGVNRVILAHVMGLELKYVFRIEQAYGALNIIDFYEDGIPVVKLLNG